MGRAKLVSKVRESAEKWISFSPEEREKREKDVLDRIVAVKTYLLSKDVFFGELLCRMRVVIDYSCPTTSVSPLVQKIGESARRGIRLGVNPIWIDSLPDLDLLFEMYHEVMHVVQDIFDRSRSSGYAKNPALRQIFNAAADIVVDSLLVESGKIQSVPSRESVGPNEIHLYKKLRTTEAIADYLLKEHRKSCPQCSNSSGAYQGQSPSSEENQGPALDPIQEAAENTVAAIQNACPHNIRVCGYKHGQVVDDENIYELQSAMISAAQTAKSRGNLPGVIQDFLASLEKPKITWQDKLAKGVEDLFRGRYSYMRPPRRRISDKIRSPILKKEEEKTAIIACDCSGSISTEEYIKFLSEIHGILQSAGCRRVVIILHDVKVFAVEEFNLSRLKKGIQITKGGTSHVDVFRVVAGKHPEHKLSANTKAKVVIAFTDMFTTFPKDEPSCKVYWVGYQNRMSTEDPPFGKKLVIPED